MKTRGSVFSTLELAILRSLSAGPKHGWALAKGFEDMTSGESLPINVSSLYSALHRLEQTGWIGAHWLEIETNRRRAKFYFVTLVARERLNREISGRRRRSPSLLHQSWMKAHFTALAACSAALGVGSNAAGAEASVVTADQARNVRVCLKLNVLIAHLELARAEDTASRILAAAGISLEWHSYSSGSCDTLQKTSTVVVDFTREDRSHIHHGALAYSRPFEGIHAQADIHRHPPWSCDGTRDYASVAGS
jgi:DNA-binding PadR family transcriptional regulator